MTDTSLSKNWAQELAKGLVTPDQLLKNDLVSEDLHAHLDKIDDQFHIRIPKIFLDEIKKGNHGLSKQFVPSQNELVFFPEDLDDPISDEVFSPVEGVTHRYPDRVLLKPTYMCGVYCRFCFRRNKVSHAEFNLKKEAYEKALEYIHSKKEIWEVILTGGDPLVMTDKALEKIFTDLSMIDHVKIIRIHTRIPSVLPSRISEKLISILKGTNKSIWIALHINSVSEFTVEAKGAIDRLVQNGIPLVLQSVLLKGVNDTQEELIQLFKTSIELKIKPYYLHYPDLAKGTQHFRIPLGQAIELFKNLHGKISGMCLPKLIVDIPGGKGKIAINTHTASQISENVWEFESPITGEKIQVSYPLDL
jgi:lysine 2,3-aminomutase